MDWSRTSGSWGWPAILKGRRRGEVGSSGGGGGAARSLVLARIAIFRFSGAAWADEEGHRGGSRRGGCVRETGLLALWV